MDNNTNKSLFQTDNLSLASTLRYFNFRICKVHKTSQNSRHVVFEFEEDEKLTQLVKDFWSEALLVEPQRFATTYKATKSFVYDQSYVSGGGIQNG